VVDGFDLYWYWRSALLWSQKDVKGEREWVLHIMEFVFIMRQGLLFSRRGVDGAQQGFQSIKVVVDVSYRAFFFPSLSSSQRMMCYERSCPRCFGSRDVIMG
jgi:hypothetical protein